MKKSILIALFLCGSSAWGQAQTAATQRYLGVANSVLTKDFAAWNSLAPGSRPDGPTTTGETLRSLLPTRRPFAFVAYIMDTRYDRSAALTSFATQVAGGQLNKMLGGVAGSGGKTELLSSSVAPDIISLATEFGAINRTTSGNTTTLRGNLAGIAGLFVGNPYLGCESLAVADASGNGCSAVSRFARGFSSSVSIDTSANASVTNVSGINAVTGNAASAGLFASGSRMSAWNARYDFQRKTVYDTKQVKGFAALWASKMAQVSASATEAELDAAIPAVMKDITSGPWEESFVAALQQAPVGGLMTALQQQLDAFVSVLASKNPQFMAGVQRAQNAIQASFLQRDEVLRELQSNKFGLVFNGWHPLGQPNLSNVRLIYSYQPANGTLLLTFNTAVEWYDHLPSGVKVNRMRDVQAAAQVDRDLGTIPQFGAAVLTFGFYYQWMRDAALLTIPAGNMAPGTDITLPGAANLLLAPKGNIAIGQFKVTLPIKNGIIKVPISFTWANRSELINESEKRGQIGLTLDFDTLFKK